MLPLFYPGQNRAPWSPSACTRLLSPSLLPLAGSRFWSAGWSSTFRQLTLPSRQVPLISRCRSMTQAIHFALDSLRRVKSTTCSGLHATPDSFRSSQNPLAAYRLRQAPTFIAVFPLPKPLLVGQVRLDFPRFFTGFRPVCFPLAGVLTV